MEEINIMQPVQPQVTLRPDKEERRQIRKKYNFAALVLIINIVLFNVLAEVFIITASMILGGGFSAESYQAGRKLLVQNELLSILISCLTPIISEVTAILIGVKIFRINLKSLSLNRDNYSGTTIAKLITLSLGLQFAAAIIIVIVQYFLGGYDLEGAAPDLTATHSFAANVILCFYACLLGPVLEEFLYRGILLQSMRKYNERFAIFLSALIFGLMHQNYQQFILGFLVGIPLAIVAIKYESILPTIFAHIFMNTTGMLQTYAIQYFAPEILGSASGSETDLSSLDGNAMMIVMLLFLIRFGILIAALVVGIVSLVKGGNMKKPTPAGKSRALPILMTAPLWWVVFAAYLVLTFIVPFMMG